jgi:DNA-binding response OmpR family regulator
LSRQKILVVVDRNIVGDSLKKTLTRSKFVALLAHNPKAALKIVRTEDPDLIILDMTSAKWNGGVVAHSLRRATEAPIIALGEPNSPHHLVQVEAHLPMPVHSRKLLKQVRELLARPRFLTVGNLTLDLKTRHVTTEGRDSRLTPKEFALLKELMSNAGAVLSRKTVMKRVWSTDFMEDTRTLDVHIRWVREKIEEDPSQPRYVRTIRGVGYQFVIPDEAGSSQ